MKCKNRGLFEHPLPKGWLRPYLFALSEMFHKRWSYWIETIENGRPLNGPIPKISFLSHPHPQVMQNIKDCIDKTRNYGSAWMSFVEWLLWGLGSNLQGEFPKNVSEEISLYWYRKFNLGLMLKYPCDYMAWASCEIEDMTRRKTGYFPTPGHIVDMMVKMQMTEADKINTVCDPCLGTGIMLLYASNYSLRLYGTDISLDMVKMAHVNARLYIPWVVYPADGLIEWTADKDRKELLKCIKAWQNSNDMLMLTYKPRINTLMNWM